MRATNGLPSALGALLGAALLFSGGCGGAARPPRLAFATALCRLGADGQSRRVDVTVDVHNDGKVAASDVKLQVTFADQTEVEFQWPAIPAYALRGASRSVELSSPAKEGSMLGGAYESLADDQGGISLYATEVKGAVLSFKGPSGPPRELEVGAEASRVFKQSFQGVAKGELDRVRVARERVERLKAAAGGGAPAAGAAPDAAPGEP